MPALDRQSIFGGGRYTERFGHAKLGYGGFWF